MVAAQAERTYTPEEYLALERAAEYRSEYWFGHIYAMAGGSPEHSAIGANAIACVWNQLIDTPCQVYNSDMKVRATPDGLFAYPDLSVVCGEPQFHDDKRDMLINPIVIMEVLSDSTEVFDRRKKFAQYQHLDSFTDYVLIAQDEPHVEHYARQADNEWYLTIAKGLDSQIVLSSIGCTLRLADVYRKITFA